MNHETHSTNQFFTIYPHFNCCVQFFSQPKKKGFPTDLKLIEEGAKLRSKVYNSSHETSHREHDKSLSNLEWHREGRLGVAVNHLFQY